MAMGVIELFEDGARLVSANALTDRFFGLAPGTLEGMMIKDLAAPSGYLPGIRGRGQQRAGSAPRRISAASAPPARPPGALGYVGVTVGHPASAWGGEPVLQLPHGDIWVRAGQTRLPG